MPRRRGFDRFRLASHSILTEFVVMRTAVGPREKNDSSRSGRHSDRTTSVSRQARGPRPCRALDLLLRFASPRAGESRLPIDRRRCRPAQWRGTVAFEGRGCDDQPACLDTPHRVDLDGRDRVPATLVSWPRLYFPEPAGDCRARQDLSGRVAKALADAPIVHDHKIKTVLALAHPSDHPLAIEEEKLARELGVRWVHIPIVDRRGTGDRAAEDAISDLLDQAAGMLADRANYPIFFHCHHGLNRTSMVQIAYRTKYCGWTLERAADEIERSVGLVKVNHGPDYRHMVSFYEKRVLPLRSQAAKPTPAAAMAIEDHAEKVAK